MHLKTRILSVTLAFTLVLSCVTTPVSYTEAAAKYYIAPHSGTKYHTTSSCRGLSNAIRVKAVSKSYLRKHKYTACRWCN